MLFQRLNQSDAEKVYAVFYNVSGATAYSGYPLCWDTGTVDGVRVTKPASANLSLVVGLAAETIADSAYGRVQGYGYKSDGLTINATAQDVTAGNVIVPVASQWYMAYSAAGTGANGMLYSGVTYASVTQTTLSAALAKATFIRCL